MTNDNQRPDGAFHPTFMFGFERSGTTLLTMMMGAHPQLAVPLTTTGMWYRLAGELGLGTQPLPEGEVDALINRLIGEERIKLWDAELSSDSIHRHLHQYTWPGIVAAFHQAYAEAKGKPHWGSLDISTLDNMDIAYQWFPDARFIHIVRDGRDVALSHETMPYGAANTLDCAQSWERRLETNLKMGAMLPASQYYVLRFEDLVLSPENTLSSLCQFMGLDYSSQLLDYGSMVDEKIPEDRRWLWPALDQKPQPSKCYGWKNQMGDNKRCVFEGEAGGMLKRLGYDTERPATPGIGSRLLELWCLIGRQGRLRRLGHKFGFGQRSKLEREWSQIRK